MRIVVFFVLAVVAAASDQESFSQMHMLAEKPIFRAFNPAEFENDVDARNGPDMLEPYIQKLPAIQNLLDSNFVGLGVENDGANGGTLFEWRMNEETVKRADTIKVADPVDKISRLPQIKPLRQLDILDPVPIRQPLDYSKLPQYNLDPQIINPQTGVDIGKISIANATLLEQGASAKIKKLSEKISKSMTNEKFPFGQGAPWMKLSPDLRVGQLALGCTGAMISRQVVMTAAHCLYNTGTNSWQSWNNVKFAPGRSGNDYPLGQISVKKMVVFSGYVNEPNWDEVWDFGLMVLSQPINVGYFGFRWTSGGLGQLTVNGYPCQTKDCKHQYTDACSPYGYQGSVAYHKCDIEGGNSGGPLYDSGDYICGVQSGHWPWSGGWNSMFKLTKAAFNLALDYKQAYP